MGQITSEGLDYIGRIDDGGYVFDQADHCMAKINDSGYIGKVGGGEIYGKIDKDGTIRDASSSVVGRIEANGYVYIHSKRVCRVSSTFIERITPNAWNAGQPSTYSGRKSTSVSNDYERSNSNSLDFLSSPFFLKLVIGIILGVVMMIEGVWGIEGLIAGPICVFLFTLVFKIFNH